MSQLVRFPLVWVEKKDMSIRADESAPLLFPFFFPVDNDALPLENTNGCLGCICSTAQKSERNAAK